MSIFFSKHWPSVIVTETTQLGGVMRDQLHVLLVDDDPDALAVMSKLLEHQGFSTTTAQNGQEALGLFEHNDFHVVITDVIMPVMDGITLSKNLHSKVPVVFVTGNSDLNLDGKIEHLCVCIIDKMDMKDRLVHAAKKAYERFQINKEIDLYAEAA